MSVPAMNKPATSAGFTLVELVATIVILAIALVGVSSMVSLGSSNSADTILRTRAMALGESYLDEIMSRRFDERSAASGLDPCFGLPPGADTCTAEANLGTEGGESSRDRYDDVDDYHGMEEGDGELTPIQDAEGNTRADYANFHVEVSVRYAGDDPVLALDKTSAKLITVTVTTRDQGGQGWKFSVYKGNY
jgi:MSHA pilin protein MshD